MDRTFAEGAKAAFITYVWPLAADVMTLAKWRRVLRKIWLGVLVASLALPATAHDFWVQPDPFWVAVGRPAAVSLWVGHGVNRELWDADIAKVTVLRSVGPNGTTNQQGSIRQGGVGRMTFTTPGTHVITLETGHTPSELPSIRFNDYVETEGLTLIRAQRLRSRQSDAPGREIYSRRAKALIRVGAEVGSEAPYVTQPMGLRLELVPVQNPYTAATGQPLGFQVLYEGRPLNGALVKLVNLAADERPVATRISDRRGNVSFSIPRSGDWQLNVVWGEPLSGNPGADFDTTFSSLTFGFDAPPAS